MAEDFERLWEDDYPPDDNPDNRYSEILREIARWFSEEARKLTANGKLDTLLLAQALDSKLREFQKAARNEIPLAVYTAEEIQAMTVKPREFLLEPFLTARSTNEIFSWRGLGKTWLAFSASYAIATGRPFLKWTAPKARPVLYVDAELDAADLKERLRIIKEMNAGAPADLLRILSLNLQENPFPSIAMPQAQARIEDELKGAELLILDNLAALGALGSTDEESEKWVGIQTWLQELRRKGVASIFLHHAGHSGWARGPSQREDLLDIVIKLERPKDYDPSQGLRANMSFEKTRGWVKDASTIEVRIEQGAWKYRTVEDARIKQVQELRQQGLSIREIVQITGIPKSTVERWLKKQPVA